MILSFPYEGRCCVSWALCWWHGRSLDQTPQARRGLVPRSASLFVEKASKLPSVSATPVTVTQCLAAPSKSEGPGAIASPQHHPFGGGQGLPRSQPWGRKDLMQLQARPGTGPLP